MTLNITYGKFKKVGKLEMSNKNLTVTLNSEEHNDLNELVKYFQDQSISTVTKSDVIKFMIKQMKLTVDKNKVNEVRQILE
jgi:hypothetical protein